ncbi:hypothetical protein MUN89_15480 [Halobacillus salinarum]|uniref:DUF2269 family protein n=1 Tax=Halobacillus salinarum TaxID=2932257 RepID=A0ABY4EFR4_9BACI|nr:hypothetical protein [Halobacillus salinarum]UOQ43311.1 hypothetical protein MUN89_15480 [Halobacillus salinarum]
MYQAIIFIHVLSAVLLGSFLILPFLMKPLFTCRREELHGFLRGIISYCRTGHYALVLLLLSGSWLVWHYSRSPSLLWTVSALALLFLLGATIGMIQRNFKRILRAEAPEDSLKANAQKLSIFNWSTFIFILVALIIMTNTRIFE